MDSEVLMSPALLLGFHEVPNPAVLCSILLKLSQLQRQASSSRQQAEAVLQVGIIAISSSAWFEDFASLAEIPYNAELLQLQKQSPSNKV